MNGNVSKANDMWYEIHLIVCFFLILENCVCCNNGRNSQELVGDLSI